MAKKKVDVDQIKKFVNNANRKSTVSSDWREGMNMVLEEILHNAGCYRGFFYLTPSEVPEGQKPGVIGGNDGPVFPDETRRVYF